MAWSSLTASYYDEKYTNNSNIDETTIFTEAAINEELQLGSISNYSGYNLNGDTTFTYTLASTGKAYEMSIDTLGNVTTNSSGASGSATDTVTLTQSQYDSILDRLSALENNSACNPKLLTMLNLPSTETSTRAIGTYYANSASYTKTNSANFDNYLSFNSENGWTVLKSGYYMIFSLISINNTKSDCNNYMIINNSTITLNYSLGRLDGNHLMDTNNTTIFIQEGTVINFYHEICRNSVQCSQACFDVYALFE